MSKLLAVDPGIRGCGVALFSDGVLLKAGYVKNPLTKGNGPSECSSMANSVCAWSVEGGHLEDDSFANYNLVVEWPQVYTSSKGDPNDLLALAGVGSALANRMEKCRGFTTKHFLPRQWKGQMSKEVCHSRIKERLSPEEIQTIEPAPKGLLHNTLDAVGIGLHTLGRLERKRATL